MSHKRGGRNFVLTRNNFLGADMLQTVR